MKPVTELKKTVAELLATQKLAVLSTESPSGPYSSLVALAASADLKTLVFATTRATRKYGNLQSNHRVAVLVDSRSNQETDFYRAVAVTGTGAAEEVGAHEKEELLRLYLEKHPNLKEFVNSPGCALIRITVEKYFVVSRFQNVQELHLTP